MSKDDNIFKNDSPWGSPPGGGGQGRGDGNGSGQRRQPPNIDDLIRKAQGSVGRIFPGGKGGNKPIYLGIIVLLVLWALSGLYRVLPDEQGVVLRFGKFVTTTQPGLNYHIPYPIERVLTPKVTKVNRIDVGFRSESDSGRSSGVGDVSEAYWSLIHKPVSIPKALKIPKAKEALDKIIDDWTEVFEDDGKI